jgi:hypothetical protein
MRVLRNGNYLDIVPEVTTGTIYQQSSFFNTAKVTIAVSKSRLDNVNGTVKLELPSIDLTLHQFLQTKERDK